MQLNLPTWLTLLRIALIPVFVGVFFLPFHGANLLCTALFGLAALTDWLDGYLARRLGQTSAFGAFLDPVADKLMVAAALVLLVQAIPTPLMAVTAMIIIGREIAISALREWMAQIGGAWTGSGVHDRQDQNHRPDGCRAAVALSRAVRRGFSDPGGGAGFVAGCRGTDALVHAALSASGLASAEGLTSPIFALI